MKIFSSREEIKQFCVELLNKVNPQLNNFIDSFISQIKINIQEYNIETALSFKIMVTQVGRNIFETRPTTNTYIIPFLALAVKLNDYFTEPTFPWYSTDILVTTLTDILENINFQPSSLHVCYAKPVYHCYFRDIMITAFVNILEDFLLSLYDIINMYRNMSE